MLLQRKSVVALGVFCLALAVYAFWIEPRRVLVTELTRPVEGLSEEIRVVMIADPQPSGPHYTAQRLHQIMIQVNHLEGDIVLLIGDYVSTMALSTSFTDPKDTAAALGRLEAPMGVYAVLGNHDWRWNGPRMRDLLEAQGITVLEDRAVLARAQGKALWIAGLSDPVTQEYDLPGTLAQTDATAPTVLLSHTPDIFPEVPRGVDFTLAGHTHGGQVYIPGIGRPIVPSRFGERYAYGHIVERDRHLFVSSGIGTSLLPVRFLTPPEVVVITLTPGKTGSKNLLLSEISDLIQRK